MKFGTAFLKQANGQRESEKLLNDGEIFGLDGGSKSSSFRLFLLLEVSNIFISQSSPKITVC